MRRRSTTRRNIHFNSLSNTVIKKNELIFLNCYKPRQCGRPLDIGFLSNWPTMNNNYSLLNMCKYVHTLNMYIPFKTDFLVLVTPSVMCRTCRQLLHFIKYAAITHLWSNTIKLDWSERQSFAFMRNASENLFWKVNSLFPAAEQLIRIRFSSIVRFRGRREFANFELTSSAGGVQSSSSLFITAFISCKLNHRHQNNIPRDQ